MFELLLAASESGESAGPWPLVIGGTVFLVLIALLLGLLAFGAGREHT